MKCMAEVYERKNEYLDHQVIRRPCYQLHWDDDKSHKGRRR